MYFMIYYSSVHFLIAAASDCDGATSKTGTTHTIIDNMQVVEYTCSNAGENFVGTGYNVYQQPCPCGGDWSSVTIPDCGKLDFRPIISFMLFADKTTTGKTLCTCWHALLLYIFWWHSITLTKEISYAYKFITYLDIS